MASLVARVWSGQIDIPPLVGSASDNRLLWFRASKLSSVIFITGLASLSEADRVFLPGDPVKSSLDLVERALYAKVPSRLSFVTRAEHVLD